MYAIINISGKQYKVTSGSRLRVPKQDGDLGKVLTFDKVLLTNDGKNTEIGNPTIKGFSVTATIINHGRDKKILVYKKKKKKGISTKEWTSSMVHRNRVQFNRSYKKTICERKRNPIYSYFARGGINHGSQKRSRKFQKWTRLKS